MKNKMKKVLSLVTTLIMLFQLLPVSAIAEAAVEIGHVAVTFKWDADGIDKEETIYVNPPANLVGNSDVPTPSVPSGFVFDGWESDNDATLDNITEKTVFTATYKDEYDPNAMFAWDNLKTTISHEPDADHAEAFTLYEYYICGNTDAGHLHGDSCPTALYELFCADSHPQHTAECFKAYEGGAVTFADDGNRNLAEYIKNNTHGAFLIRKVEGVETTTRLGGEDGQEITINFDDTYNLYFKFMVDSPVVAGEEYYYDIPAILLGGATAQPSRFFLEGTNIIMGSAVLSTVSNEGKLIVTFTDEAVMASNVTNGSFTFWYTCEERRLTTGGGEGDDGTYVINIGGENVTITIIGEHTVIEPAVTNKVGTWNKETGKFEWTITVKAANYDAETTIHDEFSYGPGHIKHKMLPDTLVVMQGNKVIDKSDYELKMVDSSDKTYTDGFTLKLPAFSGTDLNDITVTYQSEPVGGAESFFDDANYEDKSATFSNRAKLKSWDATTDYNTNTPGSTTGWMNAVVSLQFDMINKEVNGSTQPNTDNLFSWKISLVKTTGSTKGDYKIPVGTKVQDTLSDGLSWPTATEAEASKASVKLHITNGAGANVITVSSTSNANTPYWEFVKDASGKQVLTITFPKEVISTTVPYLIINTPIDYEKIQTLTGNPPNVRNDAKIIVPGANGASPDDYATINVRNRDPYVSDKSGAWSRTDGPGSNGAFTWTIDIKATQYPRSTTLVDTFKDGDSLQEHEFVPDSLKIERKDTNGNYVEVTAAFEADDDYEFRLMPTDSAITKKTGIEIDLPGFTSDLRISYQTVPHGDSVAFLNKVKEGETYQFGNNARLKSRTGVSYGTNDVGSTVTITVDMISKESISTANGVYGWKIHLVKVDSSNIYYGQPKLPADTKVHEYIPAGLKWDTNAKVTFTGIIPGILTPFTNEPVTIEKKTNGFPYLDIANVGDATKPTLTVVFPAGISTEAAANLSVYFPTDPKTIGGVTQLQNSAVIDFPGTRPGGNPEGNDGSGVGVVNKMPEFEKTGKWDRKTGTIIWTVKVVAPDPSRPMLFVDEFKYSDNDTTSLKHEYVDESLKINKTTIDGDDVTTNLRASVVVATSPTADSYGGIKFQLAEFTGTIFISYKTQPTEGALAFLTNYTNTDVLATFSNRVTFKDKDEKDYLVTGDDKWREAQVKLKIEMIDKEFVGMSEERYQWQIHLSKIGDYDTGVGFGFVELPAGNKTKVEEYIPDGLLWDEDGSTSEVFFTGKTVNGGSYNMAKLGESSDPSDKKPYWSYDVGGPNEQRVLTIHFPDGVDVTSAAYLTICLSQDQKATEAPAEKLTNTVHLIITGTGYGEPSDSDIFEQVEPARIEKKSLGYNMGTNEIQWEIKANTKEADLESFVIYDALNLGATYDFMELVSVKHVNDGNQEFTPTATNLSDVDWTYPKSSTSLDLFWVKDDKTAFAFHVGATDKEHTFIVTAKIKDSYFKDNNGNPISNPFANLTEPWDLKLKNHVDMYIPAGDDSRKAGEAWAEESFAAPIEKKHILRPGSGNAIGNTGIDVRYLESDEMVWSLTMRGMEKPGNAPGYMKTIYTDTLPGGGTFTNTSRWTLFRNGVPAATGLANISYYLMYNYGASIDTTDPNKLIITFPGEQAPRNGFGTLVLNYVSKVSAEEYRTSPEPVVENRVTISGEGIESDLWNGNASGKAPYVENLDKSVDTTFAKSGRVTWTITINARQGGDVILPENAEKDVILTDFLPQNLEISGPVTVKQDGEVIAPPPMEIFGKPADEEGYKLVLTFEKEMIVNHKIEVIYDTVSLSEGSHTFTNRAELSGAMKGSDTEPSGTMEGSAASGASMDRYLRIRKVDEYGVGINSEITFILFTKDTDGNFTKKIGELVIQPNGYSEEVELPNVDVVIQEVTSDGNAAYLLLDSEYDGLKHAMLVERHSIGQFMTVTNRHAKTSLMVEKVDSRHTERKLSGAVFELSAANGSSALKFSETGKGRYVMDRNGTITELEVSAGDLVIDGLTAGDYIIKEIEAPTDYPEIDPTNPPAWNVKVGVTKEKHAVYVESVSPVEGTGADSLWSFGDNKLTVKNDIGIVYASFSILKFDEENNIALQGASFTLTDVSVINDAEFTDIKTTTDENGIIDFENIPAGVYTLTEDDPPAGFGLNEDGKNTWSILITEDGEVFIDGSDQINKIDLTEAYKILNVRIEGTLRLYKVDDEGLPLIGAAFVLTANENGIAGSVQNGVSYGSATVSEVDANGFYVFDKIPQGSYTLTESVIPSGYRGSEEWDVVVDENGNVTIEGAGATRGEVDVGEYYAIENAKIKSSFAIFKMDDHGVGLAGATFELRSTSLVSLTEKLVLIEQTTTMGDAILEFSNLPQGEYILEETRIPAGYEAVANKTTWNVTVTEDAKILIDGSDEEEGIIDLTHAYEIMNCEVTTPFSIVKQDENGNTLEGAIFTLSGTLATGKTFTTRTDTVAADGTINYGELPEGTYTLTEAQSPAGYAYIGGKNTWTIVIAHDRAITVDGAALSGTMLDITGNYIIQNRLVLNRFEVRKVDGETGANLAGAIFTLTGGAQNVTIQSTTNGFGIAVFENLAYGTYILTETRAPAGYVPSDRTWTFEIDGTTNEIVYLGARYSAYTLRVPNTPAVPGEFTLTKVDSATNAPLSGAQFTLTGGAPYMSIDGTSAANGTVAFTDLNPGNYTLTETAAPYGYMVTTATRQITVGFDGVVTMGGVDLNVTPLVVPNDAVDPTGFSIRKTSATTAIVLAGAQFSLLNRTTGETQTATTGADGMATFGGMLPGSYTLTETAAPAGYVRPTTTWTIIVSPEGVLTANGLVNGVLNITNATTTTIPGGGRPNRTVAAPPPGDEMLFEFDDMAVPLFGPGMPLTGFLSDNTWLWVLLAVSGITLLAHLLIAMRTKKKKNGKA